MQTLSLSSAANLGPTASLLHQRVWGAGRIRFRVSRSSSDVKPLLVQSVGGKKGSPIRASHLGVPLGIGMLEGGLITSRKLSHKRVSTIVAQAAAEEHGELVTARKRSSGASVYPPVIVACLGAVLFGYHLGVVNGAMDYLAKDLGFSSSTLIKGAVVSSTLAGAFFGSLIGGNLADKFGRTRTFQLNAIPLIVGTVLSATAPNWVPMVIGRTLAGLGIGVSSAIVPLYISEISPTDIRGTLGSWNQLSICFGILFALIAGLPLAGSPSWWRGMFALAIVPAVLLCVGMSWCPESPHWLYKAKKFPEAENAIGRLWGSSRVEEAMAELTASGTADGNEDASWTDLASTRYRKVVSVGIFLFLLQQLAGINAVVYFSTTVFRSAGITSDVLASAAVGAFNVIGTLVASYLMDKQGRKSLLLTSFSGMAVSMLVLSLGLSWPALASYSGYLAIIGTVLYILAFSLGAGPVPALLLPEIFPGKIRAKAVSLSLGVHWFVNFGIGLLFLPFVELVGVSAVYLCFSVVCFLAVLYVSNFVTETKGKSLEDIQRALCPSV